MDANERLLSQVLQERSAHGRFRGAGSGWLLTGGLVLVVIVVGVALRAAGSSGVGGVPAPRPLAVATVAAPAVSGTPDGGASGAQPAATAAAVVAGGPRRYVVQPGDSLESIATRAGLSPTTLASVNQLDDPDLLQPGSQLEIPTTDGVLHVVASGETLRSIAQDYDVDVSTVVAANRLTDPDHIAAGLRLFIPGGHPPLTAQDDSQDPATP
jgi:LysM repeat protein